LELIAGTRQFAQVEAQPQHWSRTRRGLAIIQTLLGI
jgi:hypothetical protein